MRNLHKVQAGRGVNAPGTPEIPEAVFEELLVNALVHRDYLVSAPIRLFIFDNRIEIISPGHLPDNLTVENIRAGNSNIRNPILVSYVAKGLLPYHGLGSGIKRALEEWPEIGFLDDRDGCLFTATVRRTTKQATTAGQVAVQVAGQVLREIALLLGVLQGEMTRSDLQKALKLKGRANFEDRYLKPALAIGLIEMTIPDKPNSRLQRYRLTDTGRRLLTDADGGTK